MRLIKFRAWNKSSQTMIYDVQDNYEGFYFNGGEQCWPGANCFGEIILNKIPVMQYTGLKDKNGKEIYEGDILNNHYYKPHVVKWDTDNCCNLVATGWMWDEESAKQAEVIGNIYENRDLILEQS